MVVNKRERHLGTPVNARTVTFAVAGDTPIVGQTNAAGAASVTYVPTLGAGAAATSLTLAGEALYLPSSTAATFAVSTKATSITYTGSLTGAPTKW
jgi:sugar/nucleoside kinase (ribokinase family)